MLDGASDEDLLAQISARDQRALRILMARHMRRALRLAQASTGSATDADDIAQEAFVRVWHHAASFDPRMARFTTWFYRIVVNLAFDRLRRPRAEALDLAADVASDAPDPLASLVASEEQAILNGALSEISERQRTAIALFHFEGLSGREGADVMNLSEKAFESLLIRARAALKQHVLGAQPRPGAKHDTR
jgi:RNA polymerase sigma-70 factor, ECF subfamily